MDIISLLGKKLKSESIIELFEKYGVDVFYEYDRLNENISDKYSASIDELGLEFSFNSEQTLRTIFIKNESPLEVIVRFSTIEEAEKYSNENALSFKKGAVEFLGTFREWIKLFYSNYSIHYEFQNSTLHMVTLEVVGA
ncbi:hypothetical protein AVL56_02565 [Alteromonas stellipolaris]|uniref:hypothetical protein n=1 Tax=Alteromonas stellipolaris TaxID=233316 RepID=UPI0007700469|nr:hypothetical protein [Alteromonas stellipolaris]AMJ93294.1 hypothetical protein AVL56_02565 [Alteromonas stellipolaris]